MSRSSQRTGVVADFEIVEFAAGSLEVIGRCVLILTGVVIIRRASGVIARVFVVRCVFATAEIEEGNVADFEHIAIDLSISKQSGGERNPPGIRIVGDIDERDRFAVDSERRLVTDHGEFDVVMRSLFNREDVFIEIARLNDAIFVEETPARPIVA